MSLFSFEKYSKLYLDATSGDVLLHELNVRTTSLKRTKKVFMSFKKRKREEAEGEEEQGGQDEARSCLLLHLVLSGLQGKNETLSFPFFMGRRKKKSFHFWSGQERESPSPSLALVSIVFVSLTSVQDLGFTLFTLFLSCDRFDSFTGEKGNCKIGSTFVHLLNAQ